jgi:rhomboid family GlyGly-CTERM serine protease
MGLRQAFGDRLLPGFLLLAGFAIAAGGDGFREATRFERAAIGAGELHRLVTGHLAHLGWSHFLLNAAGLGLVWLLVGGAFSLLEWLVVAALCVAAIDAGLWILLPTLDWYVGLSGLLHGLLAAGAAGGLRRRPTESLIILFVVALKLAYETLGGPMPGAEGLSGGPVVTEAHLYGAVAGAVAGALLSVGNRPRASI